MLSGFELYPRWLPLLSQLLKGENDSKQSDEMQATQNQQKPETGFEKIPFTKQFMRWATLLAESLRLFLDKSWEILDSVLPFSH